jgi:Uma2 family endonuclease
MEAVSVPLERLITAEEFTDAVGFELAELIDGRIVEVPPPDFHHGRVELRLAVFLDSFVRESGLGAVGSGEISIITRRNPDRVRGADIVVLLGDQVGAVPESGPLPFVPALVVEVVSPSDRWADVMDKVGEYLEGGARLVWVADRRRQVVHVCRPGAPECQVSRGENLSGEDVLPGLSIPVEALFED